MLVCSGIFLAIFAATLGVAAITLGQLVSLARRLRAGNGGGALADKAPAAPGSPGPPAAGYLGELFMLVFGTFTFCLFSMILLFALSLAGDALHRKGEFSGAGAYVSWPSPG